ncbi:DNA gyrase subunit A [Tumebacillus flagellatus]|uniref:DNA gyrase subunit A n=1 Tax=Tumebacillus flagellatus TaxID=1157490 RepID=A0A074LJF2_9BACL|nr:DNA gyrase subunit A [Tumebacillus flagellatus]KEO81229.1 DNA gyrase subunit A [Tumebacillus flagellatus]
MADIDRNPTIDIASELKSSFIDYAMSVIVSRALPDVRDGLKPVHRRILYAMFEAGMTPDKPYKKSARVVGDVLAKYHPHGDSSVYDALVRMAQDFNTRYLLVDGHGNFGSVDGDAAAAMRYTESRMSQIAMELLRDINKETVDFVPNYDGSEKQPDVLPSRFPNLLVNGSNGIAVGMATNIPPHNLTEVINGVLAMIENPEITVQDLMKIITAPDFPTAGLILGRSGIRQAYETGRGSIIMRAKTHIEEANNGKARIIVTELPYQVNKARLVEKIAELVRDKKIDGITDLRDESDRTGMRVVIELRRDVKPQVVLMNLFKHTQLQSTFGVNMLALVNKEPRVLNLREVIYYYLEHQKDVITRRTQFELKKARARAHILEGLRIALDHIDEVIALIRANRTTEDARNALMERFGLSEEQSQAILDMRLQRLTGLERDKIENEYKELMALIAELESILADQSKLMGVIRDEITEIRDKFGDERRTVVTAAEGDIDEADLIPVEDVVITITHQGYIKRLPANTYRSQKRGGRGVTATGMKEEDFVEHLFTTSSHNYLLFFTNRGKAYRIKAYEVPEFGRAAKGTPIINVLNIEQGEMVSAVIPLENLSDSAEVDVDHDDVHEESEAANGPFLFLATRRGIVKKTPLTAYQNIRKAGLIALTLKDEDELIGVKLTDGNRNIILGTRNGMSVHFPENDVRSMGRNAAGVKGIELDAGDYVIDMDVTNDNCHVLVVSSKGYGKRSPIDSYRIQGRGGRGLKTIDRTEKTGHIAGLKVVTEEDDIMVITNTGVVIRMAVNTISELSRITQGVKLITLHDEEEEVSTVARVPKSDEEETHTKDEE